MMHELDRGDMVDSSGAATGSGSSPYRMLAASPGAGTYVAVTHHLPSGHAGAAVASPTGHPDHGIDRPRPPAAATAGCAAR